MNWLFFFTKILFIRYRCRVFIICNANSQWFHNNTLTVSWTHYGFIVFSANSLWIRYLFANSLWIHHLFADSLRIYYQLLWIHYLFHELTIDSLSFSRKHYQFIIFVVNKLWIHFHFVNSPLIYYLFRENTIDSLSHYKLTIDSLSFSPNYYSCTIYLTI